jgi:hypothetical protein
VARGRQRILLRRRVHQGINVIPERREKSHGPFARPAWPDALPF